MITDIEPHSIMQSTMAASSNIIPQWPSLGSTGIFLIICSFFLLLNAFFVASEFAIVKVRPSQIDTVAHKRPKLAKRARQVVDNLDAYLSANQLGITLASLGLAIFAEPYIDDLLKAIFMIGFDIWFGIKWFTYGTGLGILEGSSHAVTLAFFTVFHVVVGELIPKALAIRKPLQITMLLAPTLHLFYVIFRPLIIVLNGAANLCLKHLFNMNMVSEGEHVHSSEELALLVEESGENKEVTDTEKEILINALELNDVYVKDVMTPRADIVTLDLEKDFVENLKVASGSKHTRFPLVKGNLDEIIGLIHIKDILAMIGDQATDLNEIKREICKVPDSMPLDALLKFFQNNHEHLAMVVNEFGELSGLVFMDNVLEELVGDIQDEFDEEEDEEFVRVDSEEFVVDGSLSLNSLEGYVPELNLHGGEMTTIGGVITQQLERFPEKGETLEIQNYEVRILSVEDGKVGQISFRKLLEQHIESASGEGAA